jgi:hypothetical protein
VLNHASAQKDEIGVKNDGIGNRKNAEQKSLNKHVCEDFQTMMTKGRERGEFRRGVVNPMKLPKCWNGMEAPMHPVTRKVD